jgi:hypothetical protein
MTVAAVLRALCGSSLRALRFKVFVRDGIKTKSQRSLRKAAENAELSMHGGRRERGVKHARSQSEMRISK